MDQHQPVRGSRCLDVPGDLRVGHGDGVVHVQRGHERRLAVHLERDRRHGDTAEGSDDFQHAG